MPGVKLICFAPDPGTTRGEAETLGRLAKQFRWTSVVLVATSFQDTRARMLVRRCFAGSTYVVAAPLPLMVIADLLGFDVTAHEDLLRWSDDLMRATTIDPTPEQAQAVIDYHLYRLFPASRPALQLRPPDLPVRSVPVAQS